MRPASGFSSPRQSLRIVLLPEPAIPSRTLVSPRFSSKETWSSTVSSSKLKETSSKIIALWIVSGVSSKSGMLGQGEEELCEHGVRGQDQHGRSDHRLRGCATDALRAALGIHAVVAAHRGDDEAKNQRLDQAGNYVIVLERLIGAVPVLVGVEAKHGKG